MSTKLEQAKKVRENGKYAIRQWDGGHRSEAAANDILAYAKQLEEANARHVINAVEKICEACGHTKTADGCPTCLKTNRPKLVCICGSSRFVAESAVAAWELNKQGVATFFMPLLPRWYPGVREHHQAEAEGVAKNLDDLWLKLIAIADEVLVINVGGYIGERTRIEITHAKFLGKPVKFMEPTK